MNEVYTPSQEDTNKIETINSFTPEKEMKSIVPNLSEIKLVEPINYNDNSESLIPRHRELQESISFSDPEMIAREEKAKKTL